MDSGLQKARFGDPRVTGVDGIHMKGSSGQIAFTRSMAAILSGAGLCSTQDAYNVGRCQENQIAAPALTLSQGYQVQRGRPAAARGDSVQFALPTENRFEALGN